MRRLFAGLYRRLLKYRTKPMGELGKTAVVFAPHPDDETLGCGGTMIEKHRAGAGVHVVVLTDGRKSHDKQLNADKLKNLRAAEVRRAVMALGLGEDALTLLNFHDGELRDHKKEAVAAVAKILQNLKPEEVFVPYRGDTPKDHFATFEVVIEAIKQSNLNVMVHEYPIWFWAAWPFVRLEFSARRKIPSALWRTLKDNTRLFMHFNTRVAIGAHKLQKSQAMACHQTQMTQYLPGKPWPTLVDIYNGEWIENFFQEFEFFHSYRIEN